MRKLLLPAVNVGTDLVNVIHTVDALELACALPAESVDCVVTSPPYPLQRVYGDVAGQWGLESTLDEYLDRMVALFAEIKRVLIGGKND